MITAIIWYIIKPMHHVYGASVVVGVVIQEAFRLVFYALYMYETSEARAIFVASLRLHTHRYRYKARCDARAIICFVSDDVCCRRNTQKS